MKVRIYAEKLTPEDFGEMYAELFKKFGNASAERGKYLYIEVTELETKELTSIIGNLYYDIVKASGKNGMVKKI